MKFYKTLVSILILLIGCSDEKDQKFPQVKWQKLGLDGKTVNEMQISGSKLYVATTTGLFKKDIHNGNGGFLRIGFSDKNVEAIEVIADQEIVVSLFDRTGSEMPALYKSNDDGETWATIDSNFGGDTAEPVFDLTCHPENKNILYGAGFAVVAKSHDQGQTWTPIYGDWGGFGTGVSVVEINPNDISEVWAGGQGAIENGFLVRSNNESEWDRWDDLVANPTVVKEIAFSPGDAEKLFVGFEGALLKTVDGGENWQTLVESEDNRFYFGIGLRNGNPNHVYIGGWLKTPDPQPLILSISNDAGTTWEEFTFAGESFGGVLDMQVKQEEDRDVIFLGLDKGGVYQVSVPIN